MSGSRRSRRRRPLSTCRPSRSPTTARSPGADRPLQGRARPGREAGDRLRGVRRRRPHEAGQGPRAPHPPRARRTRATATCQALLARLPRGLLLPPARRLGAARALRDAGSIALSGCLSGRVSRAISESRMGDAEMELDRLEQIFGRDNVYVELQNGGLDIQRPPSNSCPGSPPGGSCRSSPRATFTTSTQATRTRTRRSSASSRATR